ncbi:hypothetical protein OsI_17845 [Oryza sativa Indica Group]|uniref:cDNA clone:002-130-B06, full insert sequence n=6 Tax=Oryza TaxID=4527 RepID=Q7XR73_ORYSJ|nr:hypothetical protein [Oryza sativa Japonica Group]EAY95974.1 hypothetical protein OsI_17845 [Oryza sativa Indica Group]CAH68313.1 B0811B10.14 [Oryza sativa]KAF2936413.1 hypothetical protein DAI22_04g301800 [Oryza sativa Japonica Group]CAE02807.1 OSJNBa0043A12.12 [Oryza sativa Japonica Group]|eukprot:NP_001054195.1 Os04g0668400 [Oryza sativa Japonica Group]
MARALVLVVILLAAIAVAPFAEASTVTGGSRVLLASDAPAESPAGPAAAPGPAEESSSESAPSPSAADA